jgi:hypothetical protein
MTDYELDYNGKIYEFSYDGELDRAGAIKYVESKLAGRGEQSQSDRKIGAVEGALAGASGAVGRTAGAIAGGAKGASIGATAGTAIAGPVGAAIGGIGGAIIGGIGGAFVGETAQKVVQEVILPDDVNKKLWDWGQQAKDDAPIAFALGEIAPSLAAFKPSPKNVGDAIGFAKELAKNKDKLSVLMQNPANTAKMNNLINVGFGGLMEGGSSLVGEMTDDKEGINLMKVAATSAAGLLINDPNKFGKWLTGGTAHNIDATKSLAEAAESATAKAQDAQAAFVDRTAQLKPLDVGVQYKEKADSVVESVNTFSANTANHMEQSKGMAEELPQRIRLLAKKHNITDEQALGNLERVLIATSEKETNDALTKQFKANQIFEASKKVKKIQEGIDTIGREKVRLNERSTKSLDKAMKLREALEVAKPKEALEAVVKEDEAFIKKRELEIKKLELQARREDEVVRKAIQRVGEIEEKIVTLEGRIGQFKSDSQEVRSLQSAINKLKRESSQHKSSIARSKGVLSEIEKINTRLRNENQSAIEDVFDARQALNDGREQEGLLRKVIKSEDEAKLYREQLNALDIDEANVLSQWNSLGDEFPEFELKGQQFDSKAALAKLRKRSLELDGGLKESEAIGQRIRDTQDKVTFLQSKVGANQKEITELKALLTSLRGDMESRTALARAQGKLSAQSKQAQGVGRRAISKTQRLDLKAEGKQLQIAERQKIIQEVEALIKAKQTELDGFETNIKTSKGLIAEMKRQWKKVRAATRRSMELDRQTQGKQFKQQEALTAADNRIKLQEDGQQFNTARGRTNVEVQRELQELAQLPYFKELKEIQEKVLAFGKKSMQLLLDEGIISKADYDAITSTHKNWVSFQRYMQAHEMEDLGVQVKNFRQGKGQPIKRREGGSDKEIKNVIENTILSHSRALQAIETNAIAKRIAKEAETAGTPGSTFMKVHTGVGKDGSPPKGLEGNPAVIKYKDGGVNKYLEIDYKTIAGQQVLKFFAGQNKAAITGMTLGMSRINRFLSNVLTKFNIAFPFTNLPRDIQDLLINHSANTNSLRRGIAAYKKLPQAMKTMIDYALGKDTIDTKLFKEAMENGLAMGGVWNADRATMVKTFEQLRNADANFIMRNLNKLFKNIEGFNQVVEMAPRMAAYMEAKGKGASPREAARLAREATVPFIRRGTAASQMGAWWLFYNASVQGVGRTIKSLSNPKVLAATTATLTTVATALHHYNKAVDEGYEDKVYEWDKRHSFVVGLGTDAGGTFRYLAIPIAWGIKPVFNTANVMAKIGAGEKVDLEKEADNIAASFVQAYNPMAGAQSVGEALMPSAFQPVMDVYANKQWTGRPIRPEGFNRGVKTSSLPAHENYYNSLRENMLGRMGITVSKELSKVGFEANPNDFKYLVEQYTGGVGKFIARSGTTIGSLLQGKIPATRDVPVLSSLLKERQASKLEEAGDGIIPVLKEVSGKGAEIEAVRRIRRAREVDALTKELATLPLNEQGGAIQALSVQDPSLANAVLERLTASVVVLHEKEKAINDLPVKDGSRARAIAFELQGMSPEYRLTFLNSLEEKKVISKDVRRQLAEAGVQWE